MANKPSPAFDRRQLLLLLLALIAIYVIVPQFGSFRQSLPLLGQADFQELGAALLAVILTYFAAAGTYWCLALYPLSYVRTLVVEIAGMFVNRLLPAGIGGIGTNYAYLRKSQHNKVEAASVVAVNNVLGVVGHGLLLAIFLALYHQNLPALQLWQIRNPGVVIGIIGLVAVILLLLYQRFKWRIVHVLREFAHQLLVYRHRFGHLLSALACSASLTLCNVMSLWLCVLAMHSYLPFIAVFVVFSFGIALGTATPTPGGLGGVEAGLVAGLVVYHVDGTTALAAVLMFRLLSYWLPLAAGAVAFVYTQRRGYI
jgi:undecaprenyl-diphosphatase